MGDLISRHRGLVRQPAADSGGRAQLALARVLLRSDPAGARRDRDRPRPREALTEESGLLSNAPFIHLERAALARANGDDVGRRRELRKAHRLFTEMGATARAEQVARELGSSTESTSGISSTSRT